MLPVAAPSYDKNLAVREPSDCPIATQLITEEKACVSAPPTWTAEMPKSVHTVSVTTAAVCVGGRPAAPAPPLHGHCPPYFADGGSSESASIHLPI